MKRVLFIFLLTLGTLLAKPCMTDIYFGNGVWNPDRDAVRKVQLRALKVLMLERAPTRLNKSDQGKLFQWKLAYNPSYGKREDLIETFWQLKESGQITKGYFEWIFTLLNSDENTEPYQKLQDIIRTYSDDAIYMFTLYETSSFKQKHNVLLVAHSQGNLFGNKMYTLMSDKQKAKFRMVSVGTPADHVMKPGQTAPYVTVRNDYVINRIKGALPGNVDGFGHTFIGTYIGSSFESRTQIALYVKNAYDDLMQNTSCVECSYVRTKVSEINKMTVECQVFGTYGTEVIGTFDAEKYNATILPNGDKSCRDPFKLAGFPNLVHTNTDGVYSWETGRFSSKEQLYSRKGKEETYLYLNASQCIKLSVNGDYYDLVESSLAN